MTNAQGIVHRLKYDDGDCVGESLRALFPEFHSKFCDDASKWLEEEVVKIVTPPLLDKMVEVREQERQLFWIDNPLRGE